MWVYRASLAFSSDSFLMSIGLLLFERLKFVSCQWLLRIYHYHMFYMKIEKTFCQVSFAILLSLCLVLELKSAIVMPKKILLNAFSYCPSPDVGELGKRDRLVFATKRMVTTPRTHTLPGFKKTFCLLKMSRHVFS